MKDPSGNEYFFNKDTGESSWEDPRQRKETPSSDEGQGGAGAAAAAAAAAAAEVVTLAEDDWEVRYDEDSQSDYYFNNATQESSWTKPQALVAKEKMDAQAKVRGGWASL
jgi:hypothetical protein